MPEQQGSSSQQQEISSEPHPTPVPTKRDNIRTWWSLTPHLPTHVHNGQWTERIAHRPEAQGPPPLPVTHNDARTNPALRQAQQLWVDYITQHDETPSHTQTKRDLKTLHKHTSTPKWGENHIKRRKHSQINAHTPIKRDK
jgi:hypothetical protein